MLPEAWRACSWVLALRVWFLARLSILAKCCLILQDQAHLLVKTKIRKITREQNLVRKTDLKTTIQKMSAIQFCLVSKILEVHLSKISVKFPLLIHLTSAMIHFPQNHLSAKDSLRTCYQRLQEKKIRIWPFVVKSTGFNRDCGALWNLLFILKETWVPVSILALAMEAWQVTGPLWGLYFSFI